MARNQIITYFDPFAGGRSFTTSADANGWVTHDDSASGSPTVACVDGGGVGFTLTNTNEVQRVSLYHNDILSFPASKLVRVSWEWKASGTLTNAVLLAGLASAYNDDEDAITHGVWFKTDGSSSIVAETDDGTIDNNDKATGQTIGSSFTYCEIDFTLGLSNVRFFTESSSSFRHVATGTTFDFSQAGNLQPMLKCEKAASTDVPILTVRNFLVEYKTN